MAEADTIMEMEATEAHACADEGAQPAPLAGKHASA